MSALRRWPFWIALLITLPLCAQQKIDDFVRDTVQLLASAKNLRVIDGRRTVAVVVGRNGNLEDARDVANKLESRAANFPALSLSSAAYRLDGGELSRIIGSASAVVILQAGLPDLNVLRAYNGPTRGVLMISRRPQDLGVFAVVVLRNEIYVKDELLGPVQFIPGGKPTKRLNPRTIDEIRNLQDARTAMKNRNWDDAIKLLSLAILARWDEDPKPRPLQSGSTVPYVPHYFLSLALAMSGDCEAAVAARQMSIIERNKYVGDDKIDRLSQTRCPNLKTSAAEAQWAIGSF